MHLVLILEDDEGMQNILRILFEANGFRAIIAATAARGERDARLHRPDIVVVDLGLPDRDGLNVIAAIRAWSSVPIVVLTAQTAEAQRLAAFELGADDYEVKVTRGFVLLQTQPLNVVPGQKARDFRAAPQRHP